MDNRWHAVALTITDARTAVYIDGRRVALLAHRPTVGDLTRLIGNPLGRA